MRSNGLREHGPRRTGAGLSVVGFKTYYLGVMSFLDRAVGKGCPPIRLAVRTGVAVRQWSERVLLPTAHLPQGFEVAGWIERCCVESVELGGCQWGCVSGGAGGESDSCPGGGGGGRGDVKLRDVARLSEKSRRRDFVDRGGGG